MIRNQARLFGFYYSTFSKLSTAGLTLKSRTSAIFSLSGGGGEGEVAFQSLYKSLALGKTWRFNCKICHLRKFDHCLFRLNKFYDGKRNKCLQTLFKTPLWCPRPMMLALCDIISFGHVHR